MHRLDIPTPGDEAAGQPVQKFGMRGTISKKTEVVGAGHDSRAEMPVPDPVHQDAGRERMFRIHQPARQFQSSALLFIESRTGLGISHHLRDAPGHRMSEREMTAAEVDRKFLQQLGPILHSHGRGHFRSFTFHLLQGRTEGLQFGYGVGGIEFLRTRRQNVGIQRNQYDAVGFRHPVREAESLGDQALLKSFPRLPVLRAGNLRFVPRGRSLQVVHRMGALEDRRQCIVIVGGNGIELMIVAAGTAERRRQKSPAQRIDLFVDQIHFQLHLVGFCQNFRADGEEPQRSETLMLNGQNFRGGQQVAGQLLDHELVVGLVVVKSVDDVVAVSPGVAKGDVLVEPIGICITGNVEPVPSPAFTVVRRCEQSVHDTGKCPRRRILQKNLNVLRGRRQTRKIERGAPNECPSIGRWRGSEMLFLQLREDERVDGRLNPIRANDRRRCRMRHRLERPEIAPFHQIDDSFVRRRLSDRSARIGCAHGHPFLQILNLLAAQGTLGRHLQILIFVPDGLDQTTLVWTPRFQRRAGIATAQQTVPRLQIQPALEFSGRTVAFIAMIHQNWPDPSLKKLQPGDGRRLRRTEAIHDDQAHQTHRSTQGLQQRSTVD